MKRGWLAVVALVGLAGIWSTTDSFEEMFCFNPTGYCGGNVPDPDRAGGPRWLLTLSTPEERMAYYTQGCEARPRTYPDHSCHEGRLREAIHDSCVSFAPLSTSENQVTYEEQDVAINACKTDMLATHGWELST